MPKNQSVLDWVKGLFTKDEASVTGALNDQQRGAQAQQESLDIRQSEIYQTTSNLSWRDLFRPTAFLTEIFHPSSIERAEARKNAGLLDVFNKVSEPVLNEGATQTHPQDQLTWGGLFKNWFGWNRSSAGFMMTDDFSREGAQGTERGIFVAPQDLSEKDKALFLAIEAGNNDQVTSLLKEGANPNAMNQYGESALQLAALKGSYEMVDALLKEGADANKVAATPEARGALLVAAERGEEAIVERLLEAGANPQQKDAQGKTALHYATSRAMMGDLLEAGADLMAEDINGRAPLHDMVARGEFEVIDEACFYGADPNKADQNGKTALMEAASRGYDQIYQALQGYAKMPKEPDLSKALGQVGETVSQDLQEKEEGRRAVQMPSAARGG